MVAIEESPSQKATAQQQEHGTFLCVIAHQGHRTRNEAQHRGNYLEQSVQFGSALPRGPVGGKATEKQRHGEKGVDESSLAGVVWLENCHATLIGRKGRFV